MILYGTRIYVFCFFEVLVRSLVIFYYYCYYIIIIHSRHRRLINRLYNIRIRILLIYILLIRITTRLYVCLLALIETESERVIALSLLFASELERSREIDES